MKPLILHDAIAGILFGVSLLLWFLLERMMRVRSGSRGQVSSEWTYTFIFVVFQVSYISAAVAACLHVAPLPGPAWWPVAAGLALLWIGEAFRLWAFFTLGDFFKVMVVVQAEHRIVDYGPYRWLRHPSYLGIIVSLVGMGLAEGDWVSTLIMSVGALTAFLVRIQVEERILLEALGEEYAAYARRTARLVPGLF